MRQSTWNYALCAIATLSVTACATNASFQSPVTDVRQSILPHYAGADRRQGDLLYASDTAQGLVVVFSYPQGKYLMTLTGMNEPRGECVDSANNVYVANETSSYEGNIYVFAHGASNPATVLTFPSAQPPYACSIDPKTGDLAVADRTGEVSIYNPSDQEWTGDIDAFMEAEAVAYGPDGTLFVGGPTGNGSFGLAEITATCFCQLKLDQAIGSSTDQYTLQWNDSELYLTDVAPTHMVVYGITISKKGAKVASKIKLRRNRRDAFALGYSYIHGHGIIAPHRSGKAIAVWNLEKGSVPRRNIENSGETFVGVTVSDGT